MKINFTKKEYRLLIEMLYITEWVVNAHTTGKNKTRYEALEQKIYAHAKEVECDDYIEYSDLFDRFFPTLKLEKDSQGRKFIEEFENDTFWNELVNRLADRDMLRKFPGESITDTTGEQRVTELGSLESKWSEEFEEYGLDRLTIKKPTPALLNKISKH